MKLTLNIEESAKLISLGISPSFANQKEFVPLHPEALKGNAEYVKPWGWFPVFSIPDILLILPKDIDSKYYLDISAVEYNGDWTATYLRYGGVFETLEEKTAPELIDALYQLLLWAIENKHVKVIKQLSDE